MCRFAIGRAKSGGNGLTLLYSCDGRYEARSTGPHDQEYALGVKSDSAARACARNGSFFTR